MKYTMEARPTTYADVLFRSRLEARWAAFFDLAGWKWEYEPCEVAGYNPDFLLRGATPVLVEVKPLTFLSEDLFDGICGKLNVAAREMGFNTEPLVLGAGPYGLLGGDWDEWRTFGFLGQRCPNDTFDWEPAALGMWNGSFGFCHTTQGYHDRISGKRSGGDFGDCPGREVAALADKFWREAGDITRFYVRKVR